MAATLRYFLFMTLLLSSAAIIAASDDDVDRTDFSDPSLNADLDKKTKPLAAHEDVTSSSKIVEPIGESLPIGVPSYLLVALANSGPKMFNVTKINGIVSDAVTGVAVSNFTRKMYGEPLGPREQRSFRFPFVPKKTVTPAQYRLTFSAYYSNRDKEPFVSVVYNELNVLVAGPSEPMFEMPDLGNVAVYAAVVLGALLAYTNFAPGGGKGASKDTTKPSEPAQWLPQNADVVGAASPGKKKKAAGKK